MGKVKKKNGKRKGKKSIAEEEKYRGKDIKKIGKRK